MLASFDLYFMLPSYHPSRRGALPRAEVALMLPIYHPSRRGALPRLRGWRVGHGDHPQPRRWQPALTDLELVAPTNIRGSAATAADHRSCPCSCTARSCVCAVGRPGLPSILSVIYSLPRAAPRAAAAAGLACPRPYSRPCVGCEWLGPTSASSRCSPRQAAGAAARPGSGHQGGPRGAERAEGRERGYQGRRRRATRCRGCRPVRCRRGWRAFERGAEPRLHRLLQAAVRHGRRP